MLFSILEITGVFYAVRVLYRTLAIHLFLNPVSHVSFGETSEPDLSKKTLSFTIFNPHRDCVGNKGFVRLFAKQPEA